MSAMTESLDMQMADFVDFDIQMQPDPWCQDLGTKMEEDGPMMFRPDSPSKNMSFTQDKADGANEVDMSFIEDYNTEYDMVDDEQLHASAEVADVDVELHDADTSIESIELEYAHPVSEQPFDMAHSVSNEVFPVELIAVENTLQSTPPQTETINHYMESSLDNTTASTTDQSQTFQEVSESTGSLTESGISEMHPQEPLPEPERQHSFIAEEVPLPEAYSHSPPEQNQSEHTLLHESGPEYTEASVEKADAHVSSDPTNVDQPHVNDDSRAPAEVETHTPAGVDSHVPAGVDSHASGIDLTDKYWNHASDLPDVSDAPHDEDNVPQESMNEVAASTGDPHEISEGVYIDPPPPILLSFGIGETFDFCLFNDGEEVYEGNSKDHILLANFPTLYYENLSYVFDELRREQSLHDAFNLAECELVLEAPDLQLTLSEDNIHARTVTLHDLHILHDISGVDGLFRIKLSQSLPRFINRYQQLQEEVNALHLGEGNDTEQIVASAAAGDEASESEETHTFGNETPAEDAYASITRDLNNAVYADAHSQDGRQQYSEEKPITGNNELDAVGDLSHENGDQIKGNSTPVGENPWSNSYSHIAETTSTGGDVDNAELDEPTETIAQEEFSDHKQEASRLAAEANDAHGVEVESDVSDDVGHTDHNDEAEGVDVDHGDVEEEEGEYEYGIGEHDADGAESYDLADDGYHRDDDNLDAGGGADDDDAALNNDTEGTHGNDVEAQSSRGFEDHDQDHADYGQEEIVEFADAEFAEQDGEFASTHTGTDDGDGTKQLQPHESEISEHEDPNTEHGETHWTNNEEPESIGETADVASSSGQSANKQNPPSPKELEPLHEDPDLHPPENAYDFNDDWDGDDDGELDDGQFYEYVNENEKENDNDQGQLHSNASSVTLSSKGSKRSIAEVDDAEDDYESGNGTPPSSPGAKRSRTH